VPRVASQPVGQIGFSWSYRVTRNWLGGKAFIMVKPRDDIKTGATVRRADRQHEFAVGCRQGFRTARSWGDDTDPSRCRTGGEVDPA